MEFIAMLMLQMQSANLELHEMPQFRAPIEIHESFIPIKWEK